MRTTTVAVVGGGAAGMLAAIAAARGGAPTLLLEKTGRLGLKLQISGGGRCNVTNAQEDPRELARMCPGNGRFMMDAFRAYPPGEVLALLRRRGVPTKVEAPYGKVFPRSDRSLDVLGALEAEMGAAGVEVRTGAPVAGLLLSAGRVRGVRLAGGEEVPAAAAVVCAGGRSFPRSGSTGDGYVLAGEAGHRVVETFPSLVPLRVAGTRALSGVALRDVEGTALVGGRAVGPRFRGDALFTHFGLSGPVVLQLSRAICDGLRRGLPATLSFNLRPDGTAADLDGDLLSRLGEQPRAALATVLAAYMPRSAVPAFLAAAGADGATPACEVARATRLRVAEAIRTWHFPVAAWHSIEAAEVTAGGVDVAEIDPRTFASRLVAGLYFAGEVLDVDCYVGGYNLQAAWSSGFVAGRSAAAFALAGAGTRRPRGASSTT
ncbi:MAG: aminoacetone oxidase family FAD-binding enzyme [Candidatus Sericytochromatia bacterium]|nr:aminoacetone oxidase family FAD-binding enzyme [Candidatus Tanganyikabacteria bacterium]